MTTALGHLDVSLVLVVAASVFVGVLLLSTGASQFVLGVVGGVLGSWVLLQLVSLWLSDG